MGIDVQKGSVNSIFLVKEVQLLCTYVKNQKESIMQLNNFQKEVQNLGRMKLMFNP